jgi:hypothetical protein
MRGNQHMTCAHVLDLIDAGPFADYPPIHLEAAWAHARQCATCGPALLAGTALTADLSALPRPAAAAELAGAVVARIASIEEAAAVAEQATPTVAERDGSAGTAACGVLAAAAGIVLAIAGGDAALFDVAWARTGAAGLKAMPATTTGAFGIATGFAIYAGGLFAALGNSRHPGK